MLKIAFCDDQLEVLKELCSFVELYQAKEEQEIDYITYQSPMELLVQIENGTYYDAIFLDILMNTDNGIKVAKEIRTYDKQVTIIFLTSSTDYAIESYHVRAAFYQLKPITKEIFYQLMDRVMEEQQKKQVNFLIIKFKDGIAKMNPIQLICCEKINRSLSFYMANGNELESLDKIEDIEKRLSGYKEFIRPHRSFLINMDYIQNISTKFITLNNQMKVPIPHGKYTKIKNIYLEYLFSTSGYL